MNSARLAVAGVALAAVAALGACGGGDETTPASTDTGGSGPSAATTTTAAVPPGALGEIVAAAQKTASTSAKVAIRTGSVKIDGGFDAVKQLVELDSDFGSAGGIKIIRVGNDLYMKSSGSIAASYSGNGKKWLHIDASTRPATSSLSLEQNDPGSTANLLAIAANDVKESGAGTYSGTIDMTKSPTAALTVPDSAKEKYQAIPFVAAVSDGYLTKVTMDMSGVVQGAGKTVTAYSAFGEPIAVKAPAAAQTQEMSAQDIKKMGG